MYYSISQEGWFELKFTVIIPTRNRKELLLQLLDNIALCINSRNLQIIVVDSSDEAILSTESYPFSLKYIHTRIMSAARQRNIGLTEVHNTSEGTFDFIAFLDDDTRIDPDYFASIEQGFLKFPKAVGISGVTTSFVGPNQRLVKRIFGIYGEPGKISRGGVNVPIESKSSEQRFFETNWLIGCSVWRYESIKGELFQDDFEGQSLFEDVIFSFQQSRHGKLYVMNSVRLTHLQSPIERPNSFKHSFAWVKNRYRLFELFENDFQKVNFWIANFGKFCNECVGMLRNPRKDKLKSIGGLIAGSLAVIFR